MLMLYHKMSRKYGQLNRKGAEGVSCPGNLGKKCSELFSAGLEFGDIVVGIVGNKRVVVGWLLKG